jgi:small subunit ribosomal protein S18
MSEDINNKSEEVNTTASAESKVESKVESKKADSRPSEGRRPDGRRQDGRGREGGDRPNMQRMPRFRKKVCRFCQNKDLKIDYKKADVLEKFLTDRGKILPRRITGTCAKHQRHIATEVKRARMIALLPFVEQ